MSLYITTLKIAEIAVVVIFIRYFVSFYRPR